MLPSVNIPILLTFSATNSLSANQFVQRYNNDVRLHFYPITRTKVIRTVQRQISPLRSGCEPSSPPCWCVLSKYKSSDTIERLSLARAGARAKL